MGGGRAERDFRRVKEYNILTNTWRNLPKLQKERSFPNAVCTVDKKIFVLGSINDTTCEMLDLSDDDPQWRYIASMNSGHEGISAAVIEKKIYAIGHGTTNVEMYDVQQGILY